MAGSFCRSNAVSLGILRGPAQFNLDLSMLKQSKLTESLNVELRGEAFNLINTPEFAPPSSTIDLSGRS